MTENQRLKILISKLEYKSQKDFAEAIGIAPGSLSDILREKKGVGVSNAVKHRLETKFGVNTTWLETGEGNMFTDGKPKAGAVSEDVAPYGQNYADQLIAQLEERLREKDDRLADKDKIIARTEESLELWKEKAQGYEKKISADIPGVGTTKTTHPKLEQGRQ